MAGWAKDFKRILFPTDLTAASEDAFPSVLGLARRYKARLYIIHVVDTVHEAAGFYVPHLSFERLHGELRHGAEGVLKKFCTRRLRGFKAYKTAILEGEPYKEIIKFVNDNKIDVIVMGTFGKGRVDRFVFGSTTERVLRKVKCPVLVVPPAK
jgi:nucleotide-binding universal stress UspA family protein